MCNKILFLGDLWIQYFILRGLMSSDDDLKYSTLFEESGSHPKSVN